MYGGRRSARRVKFSKVSVLEFNRVLGRTVVPERGGFALGLGDQLREADVVMNGHRLLLVGQHQDPPRVVRRLLEGLNVLHGERLCQVDVRKLDAETVKQQWRQWYRKYS